MSDPKRWLEASPFGGGVTERLILAGKRLDPPAGVVERSWSEFSAALGVGQGLAAAHGAAPGTASSGTATGAVSTLTGSALGKSFLIGALLGTAVAGTVPAVRSLTHQPRARNVEAKAAAPQRRAENLGIFAPAAAEPAPPSPSPLVVPPAPEPATPARPPRVSARMSPSMQAAAPPLEPPSVALSPSAVPEANQLKLEALALAQASRLLAGGDAAAALTLLSRAAPRTSALVQERDALLVEALMRTGNVARGREIAEGFLRAHPDGPLADRVRRWSDRK